MKIKVTKEHIKVGRRECVTLCPIALAIREQQEGAVAVLVFSNVARINGVSKRLPSSAIKFIQMFDKKKSLVKPFEFEL